MVEIIGNNTLYHSKYEDIIINIPDKSVNCVLADIPYGTTKCKWDNVLDLTFMWKQLERVLTDNGVILLFAQTPYDKVIGNSNLKMLRYEWIWEKSQATGGMNSKKMPMKAHENILVFYKKLPYYNPIKTVGHVRKVSKAVNRAKCIDRRNEKESYLYNKEYADKVQDYDSTERFPRTVLKFASDKQKESLHETQKPLKLLSYLLNTYTKANDTVLDFTMGSNSTGISCLPLDVNYIGIEKELTIFNIAKERTLKYVN